MLDYERRYYKEGYSLIAGADEAGRGPLAGPLYAASCILPTDYKNELLNDSKKLTSKQREVLFEEIKKVAVAYKIVSLSPEEVDELNPYAGSRVLMKRATLALKPKPDLLLTDAMPIKDLGIPVVDLIKGDGKCACIAAASILAKVSRDAYMVELDKKYPGYGFAEHKGYGTKQHLEALKNLGPIKGVHRYSYAPVKECLLTQLSLI